MSVENFPFWFHLTDRQKEMMKNEAIIQTFKTGQIIDSNEQACIGLVMVLSGSIRVSVMSEDGREITLYHLNQHDICVTTAACVISQITFETLVTVTKDTRLLVIPPLLFANLLEENIFVKAYTYQRETERFSQAMWVMQEVLFKKFDQRLASYLLNRYEMTGNRDISMTQEELAQGVNSAREVVSRMLRQFSLDGLVELKRGHVRLLDIDGLRQIL